MTSVRSIINRIQPPTGNPIKGDTFSVDGEGNLKLVKQQPDTEVDPYTHSSEATRPANSPVSLEDMRSATGYGGVRGRHEGGNNQARVTEQQVGNDDLDARQIRNRKHRETPPINPDFGRRR